MISTPVVWNNSWPVTKISPGNAHTGGNVFDSELKAPISYSHVIVTIAPSHLVLEIFTGDKQTNR